MGKWILGVAAALYFAGFFALLTVPENIYEPTGMGWFGPKPEDLIARGFIEDLRERRFVPIEAALDPKYLTSAATAQFAKLASFFPAVPPLSIKLVGSHVFYMSGKSRYSLLYEYEFPHKWTYAEIFLQRSSGGLRIEGLHIGLLSMSFERHNAFSLSGKSPAQIFFLLVTLLNAVFVIVTGFACLAAPIRRWKWLWMAFVLVGLGAIRLNWTTGALNVQVLSFVLFGASVTKPFYGPAILQIGLPIGATIFWLRRTALLLRAKESPLTGVADISR